MTAFCFISVKLKLGGGNGGQASNGGPCPWTLLGAATVNGHAGYTAERRVAYVIDQLCCS